MEANVEKADALSQQLDGTDQTQMQGYQDRSKYRAVVGTKYARELILKIGDPTGRSGRRRPGATSIGSISSRTSASPVHQRRGIW
jgi:hypothetical protein